MQCACYFDELFDGKEKGTPNGFRILNSVLLHINVVVYIHIYVCIERERIIVVDRLGTIPFVTT